MAPPLVVDRVVEDHKHCIVCGRAVTSEKPFCSPACEELFKKHQARLRRTRLMMLAMLAILFVILIVAGLR